MEDHHIKRTVDASVEALLSFSSKHSVCIDVKENLLNLNTNQFEFVLEQIRKSANVSIIDAIKQKESFTLPRIGTFKYKKGRELAHDAFKEICRSYGYENVKSIPDPILKEKVRKEVIEVTNAVRLANYFNEHKGRTNKVLSNFKVK